MFFYPVLATYPADLMLVDLIILIIRRGVLPVNFIHIQHRIFFSINIPPCQPFDTQWYVYIPLALGLEKSAFCSRSVVRWVTCRHGLARTQVEGGGDGLQVWKVAENILNKQSRPADKEWS
jgi:hypothetical protein